MSSNPDPSPAGPTAAITANAMAPTDPTRLTGVRWSGVLTWVAATVPLAVLAANRPDLLSGARLPIAIAAALGFTACWWPRLAPEPWRSLLQVALALTAIAAMPFPLDSSPSLVLLAIIAVPRFPLGGRERLGLAVVATQTAVIALVYRNFLGGHVALFAFTGSIAGLQLFAYAVARILARESRTNRQLSETLSELAATQSMLTASERFGERMRIARDLHDSIGHHLTTMALHLDLAQRQPRDEASNTLATAHAICRMLLSEVRDVLHDIRTTDGAEFAATLRDIVSRIPGLAVDLQVPDDLGALESDRAHVLLRCGQEFITNALRHANASRLTLRVDQNDDRIEFVAADDGRGLQSRRAGGGLDALEHRLEQLGGTLHVGPAATSGGHGQGTVARASLPRSARSA